MNSKSMFGGYWGGLVPLAVVALFVAQMVYTAPGIITLVSPLIENPSWSYQQKMRARLGEYDDMYDFLAQQTPADAIILLRPRVSANIDPYFLAPRRLYYGSESTLKEHPEIEYVEIDGDFPAFEVDGEKLMLDSRRGVYLLRR